MPDRAHLVSIVQRIIDVDGPEEEIDDLIREFLASVPHPDALDILGKHDSAEAIVDEVLSYKPQPMPSRLPSRESQ